MMYGPCIHAILNADLPKKITKEHWKIFCDVIPEGYFCQVSELLCSARTENDSRRKQMYYQNLLQHFLTEFLREYKYMEESRNRRFLFLQYAPIYQKRKAVNGTIPPFHIEKEQLQDQRKETIESRSLKWLHKKCCSMQFSLDMLLSLLIRFEEWVTGESYLKQYPEDREKLHNMFQFKNIE